MKKIFCWLLVATWLALGSADLAQAQNGRRDREDRGRENEPPALPNDERLLALHRKFVTEAEELAREYENDNKVNEAMAVYSEILKLVPQYPPARTRLRDLRRRLATAEKVEYEVAADEEWQDSGVMVQTGMPVTIRAAGTWTFNLSRELGPDGMEIPEELRDYNLGTLIAVINTGNTEELEPFVVGEGKSFTADRSGRLYFRMYDIDPRDNEGSIRVEITGTFDHR